MCGKSSTRMFSHPRYADLSFANLCNALAVA